MLKVAMWAVFLFMLGFFGIFLINTFGVITTTNQQDFTLLKNAVEAAMLDSLDEASYKSGFYLCYDVDKTTLDKDENGALVFKSANDYHIVLNRSGLDMNTVNGCDYLVGKNKISKDVFVENFLRRFANNINNNKSYEVTIQEVIEYPPKVSVRIDTYNSYNSSQSRTAEFSMSDYDIRNQIDSILEEK